MGQFGQINPGDDVRRLIKNSAWINHVTNAADYVAPGIPSPAAAGIPGQSRLVIDVVNNSGAAIDAPFPILRLTDPVVTLADNPNVTFNDPQFMGDTPDATTAASFVVVQGPIGVGVGRQAVLTGLTWCKVNVGSESDTHATSIDGDNTKLQSGTSGARIVWKDSGTGEKWALVLLGGGGSALQLFKATTGISAASGLLEADRGLGTVQPLNNATGVADGDPIEIANPGFDAFTADSVGWMNTSNTPPLVVSVFCTESS